MGQGLNLGGRKNYFVFNISKSAGLKEINAEYCHVVAISVVIVAG